MTTSPTLKEHQDLLKLIYSFTTDEEFDNLPNLFPNYPNLKENNKQTLLMVADRQRMIQVKATITQATEQPKTRAEEIAEEYKEVDEEQFGPTEVVIEPIAQQPETKPTLAESVTEVTSVFPEKTRKKREPKVSTETPTQSSNSYTLRRVVKLPIKDIQFSNNEFSVEVTAGSSEEAMTEVNTLLATFMKDSEFISKSQAAMSEEDLKNLKRYERLKNLINYVATHISNRDEMDRLKAEFSKHNPPIV